MAIKPDRFSLLAGCRYGRAEFQRRGLGKRGHETWPKLAQKFPSVDEEFFVLSDLFEWKNLLSARRLFNFQLNEMTEPEYLSEFRFGKRDILM